MAQPSYPLIYDLGAHVGQDTEYYLKRGFRVVAVEANPILAQKLRERFASHIAQGELDIVEAAIAEQAGTGNFYMFDKDVFGTISQEWSERNIGLGARPTEITVKYVTLADVYQQFGEPYYMKIDIEGADRFCITALKSLSKPKYLSIEVEKHDIDVFVQDAQELAALGYSRFQLVQQQAVPFARPPVPAREGVDTSHRFPFGASGLFGRDLPEHSWVDLDELVAAYRPIVRQHARFGDYGLGKTWAARQALRVLRLYPGWHDVHCELAS